jgi:hypothetical protein
LERKRTYKVAFNEQFKRAVLIAKPPALDVSFGVWRDVTRLAVISICDTEKEELQFATPVHLEQAKKVLQGALYEEAE